MSLISDIKNFFERDKFQFDYWLLYLFVTISSLFLYPYFIQRLLANCSSSSDRNQLRSRKKYVYSAIMTILAIGISCLAIAFSILYIIAKNSENVTIVGYALMCTNFFVHTVVWIPFMINSLSPSGFYFTSYLINYFIVALLVYQNIQDDDMDQAYCRLIIATLVLMTVKMPILLFYPCKFCMNSKTRIWSENTANLFSRINFLHLYMPLFRAWRLKIKNDNAPKLDDKNQIPIVTNSFMQAWNRKRYYSKSSLKLWWFIFTVMWRQFFVLFAIRIIYVLSTLSFAFVAQLMQSAVNNQSSKDSWKFRLSMFLFIGFFFIESYANNHYFHYGYYMQKQFHFGTTKIIYTKLLNILMNTPNDNRIIEKMLNFISNDIPAVTTFIIFVPTLLIMPFELIGFVYALYKYMSFAIFIGLGSIFLFIATTIVSSSRSKYYTSNQLKCQDERIKALKDFLNGIRIIKLYGWEEHFEKSIEALRDQEIRNLKKESIFNNINTNIWNLSSIVLMIVTFLSFIFAVHKGNRSNIKSTDLIPALYLLNLIRIPISMLPIMITALITSISSLQRLNKFLSLPERSDNKHVKSISLDPSKKLALQIAASEYEWSKEAKFALKIDRNLQINEGELVGIAGKVGSGKSSFFSTILGQTLLKNRGGNLQPHEEATIEIQDSIAYVTQEPWIRSKNVKENILFNNEYLEKKYRHVVKKCSLLADFEQLPASDNTMIGERGENLSGGQKQRIALARAVYADKSLYILDDPLSALDVHVGNSIFRDVISKHGMLNHKTRLFASNNPVFLEQCDRILVFDEGHLVGDGSYHQLNTQFEFLKQTSLPPEMASQNNDDRLPQQQKPSKMPALRRITALDSIIDDTVVELDEDPQKALNAFFTGETVELGEVNFRIIRSYFVHYGKVALIAILLSFLVSVTLNVLSDYFFYLFLYKTDNKPSNPVTSTTFPDIKYFWLYVGFAMGFVLVSIIFYSCITVGAFRSSQGIHRRLLNKIIHWPLSLFAQNPTGRIVNKFSKDLHLIDFNVPRGLHYTMLTFTGTLVACIQIIVLELYMSISIAVVVFFLILAHRIFVSASRQFGRLELMSRTPILNQFIESYAGNSVISAMNAQSFMIGKFEKSLSAQLLWHILYVSTFRWIAITFDFIMGSLLLSYLLIVYLRGTNEATRITFTIGNIKKIGLVIIWFSRMMGELELHSVSMERLKSFDKTSPEAAWHVALPITDSDGKATDYDQWPSEGKIEFRQLHFTYKSDTPESLSNINLTIPGGSKVGVVGRTGAGKSTLISALFRIVEFVSGRILIDNVDISQVGLHQLRKKISIIPQDPVIFNDTVRANLDPESKYSDSDIWKYLKIANLDKTFESNAEKLDYICKEDNFSLGQKQLICLVRALLRKSKILLLDEATASVDQETDRTIQETIRNEFKSHTIITIAHRLQTIIDYDYIIVLHKGKVIEFDTPKKLIKAKKVFYEMCLDANLVDSRSLE